MITKDLRDQETNNSLPHNILQLNLSISIICSSIKLEVIDSRYFSDHCKKLKMTQSGSFPAPPRRHLFERRQSTRNFPAFVARYSRRLVIADNVLLQAFADRAFRP